MSNHDVIDEIINGLNISEVPAEFIISARITDFSGVERVIQGRELQDVMDHPERYEIAQARVVLNVRKLRRAILQEVNQIYATVESRLYP